MYFHCSSQEYHMIMNTNRYKLIYKAYWQILKLHNTSIMIDYMFTEHNCLENEGSQRNIDHIIY